MNPTATAARPVQQQAGHWYSTGGEPVYTQIAKSTGLPRPTTLADARKQNLLPSVTTILKVLHKEGLVNWQIEQACLAVLTSPRSQEEGMDAFVTRILHTERIQDQEAQLARDRGTEIHAAMEAMLVGLPIDPRLLPWVTPVFNAVRALCPVTVHTEFTLVGPGYAGKCDLIAAQDENGAEWVFDFKTSKKLPAKSSWWEHQLQTAAYLNCRPNGFRHANVYISTLEPGDFIIHENPDPRVTVQAFLSLVNYWQIANDYVPHQ